MIISSIKFSRILICVFAGTIMLCMAFNPSTYMQATYQGVVVWATAVLPALFPFFFLTNILASTNVLNRVSSVFKRPFKLFYNAPKISGFVFIMSIISGYPVGAKLIADLYNNKQIDKFEAVRMNAFTSCSGPIFIIGTVGTNMFLNSNIGFTLLGIHFLGTFLNGFIYRNYGKKEQKSVIPFEISNQNNDVLGTSIKQSVFSILIVGGYIAISFLICAFLTETRFVEILIQPIGFVLKIFNVPKEFATSIVLGFTEITRGCFELANLTTLNLKIVIVLSSFIISFGGLSVALQSMTFLKQCGIKTSTYLLQKLSQATITTVLAIIVTFFM